VCILCKCPLQYAVNGTQSHTSVYDINGVQEIAIIFPLATLCPSNIPTLIMSTQDLGEQNVEHLLKKRWDW